MFNVIYNVVITLLFIIFFVVNSKIFKKKLNYLNMFIVMYYIIIVLSSTELFGFSIPLNTTYIYLLVALVFFEMFSLLFLALKINVKKNYKNKRIKTKRILFISIVVTLLMIPSTLEGIKVLQMYGFTGVRSAAFSNEIYSSYTKIFLTYILIPLNKVIFAYALVEYFNNSKTKLIIILSIINSFQNVLTFGGRSVLLDIIILTITIIYIQNGRKFVRIIKKNKLAIAVILLLLILIESITSQRSLNGNNNIFFNAYSYYVGSIHLLNVHIRDISISLLDGSHLLYGKAMLSPFFDIFKIIIKLLGVNTGMLTGVEIINEQIQQYLWVSNIVKMNNNVTFIYVCLRDFGLFGLAIGPLYISLWYSIIYKKYINNNCIKYVVMYCYVCSVLPYFIFTFYINNTSFLMSIIYIILIYSFCYVKERNTN